MLVTDCIRLKPVNFITTSCEDNTNSIKIKILEY